MRLAILFLAVVIALSIIFVPRQSVLAHPFASSLQQASTTELIAAVNALRVSNGLPAYMSNSMLMQVAQDQANYMAAAGQVAHRAGLTQRILATGYPLAGDLSLGGFRAENITGGNKTAAQVVQEWTGDALHTNTMLSPNLTEIGAGVAQVGGRYYFVIDCARPTTSGAPQAYTPNPDSAATESFAPSDFIVPITTSTPDEDGMVYHKVQYGQTLWAIAIEYGVKIDEIRSLNNLGATSAIYQGDRLLVRKDAPPMLATTTSFNEDIQTPTVTLQPATATDLFASMPLETIAPTHLFETSENNSVARITVGIVLATLLIAGVLTWMSSRRGHIPP